jgi:hypothetical protein
MSLDDELIVKPLIAEQGSMTGKGNVQNMKKKWYGTWPADCDLCDVDLEACNYFVDGRIKNSYTWAMMCPICHKFEGVGLGTGRGQKYDSKTLEKLEG